MPGCREAIDIDLCYASAVSNRDTLRVSHKPVLTARHVVLSVWAEVDAKRLWLTPSQALNEYDLLTI
jgi:7,8-dihydro-6-hydroxymethylpterin-pyrophosphokinase